jgi:hypothetical protein
MSDRLWAYLLDEFAIWGAPERWADRLRPLTRAFDGIMLVLPSRTTPRQVAVLGRRLHEALPSTVAAPSS